MTREILSADQRKKAIAYFDVELDDAGLDPYTFRAYCRIARRAAGHDSGACTESVENMATNCQMSRPTMVRALATLIRRRMIQRIHRQGYTSVYVLLDKSQWIPLVNDRTTPAEAGKSEIQPLVNQRTTPGKPESQPLVNDRTTKKTREENKKENKGRKTSGDKSPAAPKSPHHNHPAVAAYRTELEYRAINSVQATMIATATNPDAEVCPADWLAFIRELAGTGFKSPHNIQVVVSGFKNWKRGMNRHDAMELAWAEYKGEIPAHGNGNGAGTHTKRTVVV